jgi:hypothetical protein
VRASTCREFFLRACCTGKLPSRLVTRQQNNILTSLHSFVDTFCKLDTPATILLSVINITNVLLLSGIWFYQSLKNGYTIYSYQCEMEMKVDERPVHRHSFTRNHHASYVSIYPPPKARPSARFQQARNEPYTSWYLINASLLLGVLFGNEGGRDMFLWNVDWLSTGLHGVVSQKTELFLTISVRTANPISQFFRMLLALKEKVLYRFQKSLRSL